MLSFTEEDLQYSMEVIEETLYVKELSELSSYMFMIQLQQVRDTNPLDFRHLSVTSSDAKSCNRLDKK